MIINYSDEEVIKGEKSIFLAGPTPRGKDETSWRKEACEILERLGFDGIVYVPEYSSWKPKESYIDQAVWERTALTAATTIVFWIPRHFPEMPGLTTNVEFGYWLKSGKVIYGRPNDAEKVKYLDWLYEYDFGRKPISDLEILMESAIVKTKTSSNKKTLLKKRAK